MIGSLGKGNGMTSERTRQRMVERLRQAGILDEAVLNAILAVPRHGFVDEAIASRAYEDTALPIGHGQTISAPYIVARMIELLRQANSPLTKVLEVGTGCGYQAAILSKLFKEVYSVERIGQLLEKTRSRIWSMRIHNLRLMHTDGSLGLTEAAPFDGIIVAAAPQTIPQSLLDQLAVGGRLVIPVGGNKQQLTVVDRHEGGYSQQIIEAVKFVPLREGSI
ncbi:protein-L-isoaspartate O-methyltransferase [Ferrovum sp. JA12]|jgi:protein-L-isoaspartate(D-aspartate) O-methyltransferase|uniref:protein-L-isoaspartate(D-aspartate) O-methyltransferase n=1 Tax=Ferrovum sp. JA12 TaxID=1356299 RepID=UPI0007137D89|nr:protein-L-isoaspartate(D-aspartate) O-methyltransferase [Ferrovum sp. JA12]KRH78535.1 protein-L-isoaspartate O-methyltransferase [Ferrovum sp. JA12]